MAFVIADRVRETTTTTGTGAVTLAGAYISFQSFSTAIGNGNNTYYTIASASSGEWEVGIGTYTSSTNSLSRDTILASSNSGSAVNFSAGSKDVFVTQPAERSLLVQSAGTGLFAGVAAFTANGVPYANSTTTLTSGSALTFDGTNFATTGKVGAGTSSPTAKLQATSAGSANLILENTTATTGKMWQLNSSSGGVLNFGVYGVDDYMFLTSTGLGIGTSSPATQFVVSNAGAQGIEFTGSNGSIQVYNRSTAAYGTMNLYGNTLYFRTGTSPAINATLDSSGNLGIGTSSPSYKLDVSGVIRGTSDALISGLTVGKGAGAVSTNTAVGASALATNSTGGQDTAIGYQALTTSNGDYNTAVGYQAAQNTTTGSDLTAVGRTALQNNTTGASNTAIGRSALASNTTASNNTAVGYQAGYSNTTGGITAFGYQAVYSNTTAGDVTGFGTQALYSNTGQSNDEIGRAHV